MTRLVEAAVLVTAPKFMNILRRIKLSFETAVETVEGFLKPTEVEVLHVVDVAKS